MYNDTKKYRYHNNDLSNFFPAIYTNDGFRFCKDYYRTSDFL